MPEWGTGFWSTILEYFFGVPVPLRNHYEIKVYTFFSLVTSKSRVARATCVHRCSAHPSKCTSLATSSDLQQPKPREPNTP